MTQPLGISVGATSLVAARTGSAPLVRPAVLALAEQQWTGFVERVGDPVPLVGADGLAYRAEQLLAAALSDLAESAGPGLAAVAGVAVPAHWGPGRRDALRDALWSLPALAAAASPPLLISDASAALRSLQRDPGLPAHGVIVVCDFGGGGISVTLADAAADYRQIGETTRIAELSGEGTEFLRALDGALERARIGGADISAVAVIGESVTPVAVNQLSGHLQMPVTVSAHPHLDAALGASVAAARQLAADAPTGMAPAPLIADLGPQSATMAAPLAWSRDEVPDEAGGYDQSYGYSDADYRGYSDAEDEDLSILGGEPLQKRGSSLTRSVPLLLGGAAAVAAVAVGGFAYTLTGTSTPSTPSVKPLPATAISSVVSSPPQAPPPAETVTMTNAPVQTVTEQAPAPQTLTTVVTVETTTTTPPTTTTTTTPTTTTTTTTTTTPTTTTTTPTTTTTTPTTTTEWDTTTTSTRRPLIPGLPPPPQIPGLPPLPNLNVVP